jgi:uncharacterized membrane protein
MYNQSENIVSNEHVGIALSGSMSNGRLWGSRIGVIFILALLPP